MMSHWSHSHNIVTLQEIRPRHASKPYTECTLQHRIALTFTMPQKALSTPKKTQLQWEEQDHLMACAVL